jgi:hypothetical protein
MRNKLLWASLLIPFVTACTWVKMAPGADAVEVAALGQDMAACQRMGHVDVSVKDRLGPYERDALKIRDELETLARNEAPGLNADTVQPAAEPSDGGQRFLAFRCKGLPRAERPAPRDEVDVTPVRD